jgi:uncharacterized membrane protein
MTEIKNGIFNTISKFIGGNSFGLATVYTFGHIIIAMICIRVITGASMDLAAIDAIVEPLINGVWFYLLHKAYRHINQRQLRESEIQYGV